MGLWKAIFTGFLADLTGSPALRGREGELFVGRELSKLSAEYTAFEDLILPSPRGDTQIDHVVFSPYGIFVIETKNYSGWIFANEKDKFWTQVKFQYKEKFQNPFRQNYKHIKAMQYATRFPIGVFHNIVVFGGYADFKTQVPKDLGAPAEVREIIYKREKIMLSESQIRNAIDAVLKSARRYRCL